MMTQSDCLTKAMYLAAEGYSVMSDDPGIFLDDDDEEKEAPPALQ